MTLEAFESRPIDPTDAARWRALGLWSDDTFGARFAAGLERSAAQPVVVHSRVRPARHAVREIDDAAWRFATWLRHAGLGADDVVLTQLPNWAESAIALCGTVLAGIVIAPIVHAYGEKELLYAARHTGARVVVLPAEFGSRDFRPVVAELRAACPRVEHVLVVGDGAPAGATPFAHALAGDAVRGASAGDPDRPAIVGFTSGSTADPKGVVHTHRSVLAELTHAAAFTCPPGAEPAPLLPYPISHVTGLLEFLVPLLSGRPLHLLDRWEPAHVIDLVAEHDLSLPGGATFFLTSILDDPAFDATFLPHIAHQGLGGSPVPDAVITRARSLGIRIARGYGATEHPSISMGMWGDDDPRRETTDGPLLPGVDVRVVDADGAELAPGEPGELLSRGPDLFAGYLDADLTRAAFADGWFATGDVVTVDADGYLTVVDRVKDIIIRGGEKISAAEVEEVLAQVPGVAEAAAIAAPDQQFGERVCAFVRVMPGAALPDLATVQGACAASGLGRQKWPVEVRAVAEFPRTASGKVRKQPLRDLLRVTGRG